MDWIIQKAVELGVSSIRPLVLQYCAFRLSISQWEKKLQSWRAIAISACEQCGRADIPAILPPLALMDYLAQKPDHPHIFLTPLAAEGWQNLAISSGNISFITGPEGGFSDPETVQLKESGFLPLQLGSRILRAETAALAGLCLLQAKFGDL